MPSPCISLPDFLHVAPHTALPTTLVLSKNNHTQSCFLRDCEVEKYQYILINVITSCKLHNTVISKVAELGFVSGLYSVWDNYQ